MICQASRAVDVGCVLGCHRRAVCDVAAAGDVWVRMVCERRVVDARNATVAQDPVHTIGVAPATVNDLLLRKLCERMARCEPRTFHVSDAAEGLARPTPPLRGWRGHCAFDHPVNLLVDALVGAMCRAVTTIGHRRYPCHPPRPMVRMTSPVRGHKGGLALAPCSSKDAIHEAIGLLEASALGGWHSGAAVAAAVARCQAERQVLCCGCPYARLRPRIIREVQIKNI
mmetsp:Transcript_15981/g.41167  ORF Transcript_15981/g.41167 Transcript_15981/m.41167 type:complete len:227 (-) Transcript_15981:204-884(-)